MLAIWIISFWESLNKPKRFNVVELGPGDGSLAKVLIKTFEKFPEFKKYSHFFMYEKSKYLKKLQMRNIKNKKVKWLSNINNIKTGPVLFIGNEFFDAIPIKQFERINNQLFEHCVCLDKKNKIKKTLIKASKKNKNIIIKSKILNNLKFIEYPDLGLKIISPMIKKIKKYGGGMLLIDYGYKKQNNLDTLQSVKKHKKNELFSSLGNADITSLVSFELLKEYFIKKKLYVENIVSQSYFLKKLGILERAEILGSKMSFKEKADLFLRLKRLLDSKYMGNLFKVILAHKNKKEEIIGFD
jgi:cyclopropane-fatty-acyl-phospholipid synthase